MKTIPENPFNLAQSNSRLMLVFAVLAAIAGAALVMGARSLPDTVRYKTRNAMTVIGIGSIAGAAMLVMAAMRQRRHAARTRECFGRFQAGGLLAHWRFKHEFWEGCLIKRQEENRRYNRLSLYVSAGFALSSAAIALIAGLATHDSSLIRVAGVIALGGTAVLWAILYAILVWPDSRRNRIMRLTGPEVVISPGAAYFAGKCLIWGWGSWRVKSADLRQRLTPPELLITIDRDITGLDLLFGIIALLSLNDGPSTEQSISIPVPPELRSAADEVIAALNKQRAPAEEEAGADLG